MGILKRLMEVPPKDWGRKAKAKFGAGKTDIPDVNDILSSRKHMRGQRHYDFLRRYEAILSRHCSWDSIEFEGRRVMEMGSGPVLGWASMGIFLGCEQYTCVDPYFNPDILKAASFEDEYLLSVYKDLSALFGPRMKFEEYLSRMKKRVIIVREELLQVEVKETFDLVLSNSCLEHVFPLDETISHLRRMTPQGGRFLHLVDFGNHRNSKNPFEGIYTVTPDEYFSNHGRLINLARGADVLRSFRHAGFEAVLVPYYSFTEFYEETPIPFWIDRYSEDELFLKAAFIAGPASK